MPRFSVITICYNDLPGLNGTLASLQQQEFTDYEHIVIDGGSRDGSPEYIEQYAHEASVPVQWISEPDKGIYDAMNKGLRKASGEIVVFMNSGDGFYDPHTLTRVDELFTEHDPEWMFGQVEFVDEARTPLWTTSQMSYVTSKVAAGLAYAPHQASYFKRSLLTRIGEYDDTYSYAADQEYVIRAGLAAAPLVVPDVLAYFLAGGTHAGATGWQREHLYQAMRRRHGLQLAGNDRLDDVYTVGMALYRDGRRKLANRYRALRGRPLR